MRKKKAAAKSVRGSRTPTRAHSSHEALIDQLALELYRVANAALRKYGLNRARQSRLFKQALESAVIKRPSARLLQQFWALGDLIATWREESPYVDEAGKPKVLSIEGVGATFESLARRFFPDLALARVVALACNVATIGTLRSGKIAMYGDTMVNFSRSREAALAQTISHAKQVFDTCLHNVQLARGAATGGGRLERLVCRVITAPEFEIFQKSIRSQLHDLCERVDTRLKSSSRSKPRGRQRMGNAGIGIYVFYDTSITGDQGKHIDP